MTDSCWTKPFKPTSIWKAPLSQTGVSYVNPAPHAGQTTLTPAVSQAFRHSPVGCLMDPTQPKADIYMQGATGGAQTACANDGNAAVATVPMDPSFIVPAPSGDNLGLAAINTDKHTYIQAAQLARCGGTYTDSLGAFATVGKLRNNGDDLLGDGLVGDTGASHMSIMGGLIRIGELVPGGKIAHAVQIILQAKDCYNNATRSNTYRWPATTSDGYYNVAQKAGGLVYGGINPKLTMGVMLALPPSFNIASLQSAPGKILAAALQTYGGYNLNTIGGANTICTEVSGDGVGTYDSVNGVGDVSEEFITVWPSSVHGGTMDQAHAANTPWAIDCRAMFAAMMIVDSQDNVVTGTAPGQNQAYARVLANYPASPVGAAWDGVTGSGTPIVPFSPAVGIPTGGGGGAGIARTGAAVTPNVTLPTGVSSLTKTLVVGEGIVLFIDSYDTATGRTVASVSDGTANVYAQIPGAVGDSGRLHSEAWMCEGIAVGGPQSIVVTMSTTSGQTTITGVECSGQNIASLIDQVQVAVNTTANPDSGPTAATVEANEYAMGHIAVHATTSPPTTPVWGSPITSATTETLATAGSPLGIQGYTVDGLQAAAAVQEFSATAAANPWVAMVITLEPAPATGATPSAPQNLTAYGAAGGTLLTWQPPTNVGDGILSTVITPYTLSGTTWTAGATHTLSGAGTALFVSGTNGTLYGWTAHSVTDGGAGTETAAPPLVTSRPSASAASPDAPYVPEVVSFGPTDLSYDWSPIAPQGTQPITEFDLTLTVVGGSALPTIHITGGGTAITQSGSEVTQIGTGAGATSLVYGTSFAVAVGDTVIVSVSGAATAAPLEFFVSDNLLNAWSLDGGETNPAGTERLEVWRCNVTNPGSMQVTIKPSSTTPTYTSMSAGMVSDAWKFDGVDLTPVDQVLPVTFTGSAVSTGASTPTSLPGELVFAAVGYKSGTVTITTEPGFTPLTTQTNGTFLQLTGADNNSMQTFWEVSGAPGAQELTGGVLSSTANGCAVLVTYQPASPLTPPATNYDATGLSTGIPYTAVVVAKSSVGSSSASAVSAIGVPSDTAAPPTVVTQGYPPAAHPAISPRYAALLQGKGN